ncbi:hypothetical protein HDV05_005852 [Chytridiales sp. JEL 0842]|nr:hypothetical protein HDV05_005852 [Chytridiales sp. JEL 0842]
MHFAFLENNPTRCFLKGTAASTRSQQLTWFSGSSLPLDGDLSGNGPAIGPQRTEPTPQACIDACVANPACAYTTMEPSVRLPLPAAPPNAPAPAVNWRCRLYSVQPAPAINFFGILQTPLLTPAWAAAFINGTNPPTTTTTATTLTTTTLTTTALTTNTLPPTRTLLPTQTSTPTSTSTPEPSPSGNSNLTTPLIVVGSLVGVALIGALLFAFIRSKRRKTTPTPISLLSPTPSPRPLTTRPLTTTATQLSATTPNPALTLSKTSKHDAYNTPTSQTSGYTLYPPHQEYYYPAQPASTQPPPPAAAGGGVGVGYGGVYTNATLGHAAEGYVVGAGEYVHAGSVVGVGEQQHQQQQQQEQKQQQEDGSQVYDPVVSQQAEQQQQQQQQQVFRVEDYLAAGWSMEQIRAYYPQLFTEDGQVL